ncbi:MAG TPA: hypothetical protein DEA08_26895 [Planctomycetes bacterium]|nr:hypothetical protein [Planctomycetota bacterium]
MGRSADISFRLIAEQKKLLTREQLGEAIRTAREQGVSLESVISEAGHLPPDQFERILRTRERHGRTCKKCGARTYLLPGQNPGNTPCEHCGGELSPAGPGGKRPPATGPQGRQGPGPGGPVARPPRPAAPPPASAIGNQDPASQRIDDHDDLALSSIAPGDPEIEEAQAYAAAIANDPDKTPPAGTRVSSTWEEEPPAPPPSSQPSSPPSGQRVSSTWEEDPPAPEPAPQPSGKRIGSTWEEDPGQATLAPPDSTPVGAPVASSGEPQQLRQQGGGFGYEPPTGDEPTLPRRSGRLGVASTGQRYEPPTQGPMDGVDDAAFMPPAEHMAQVAAGMGVGAPRAPAPPLRTEIGKILALPLNGTGIAFIVMGALLVTLLNNVPFFFKMGVMVLILYPTTYMIRVMRAGMIGHEELPDWPDLDFGELFGNGIRVFMVGLASFLPIVLGFCLFTAAVASSASSKPKGPVILSIGEMAHQSAGTVANVPKGTDVSDVTFTDVKEDVDVKLGGGRWTIVGMLGQSLADDTGMTQEMIDMPTGNVMVGTINHGYQIYDLDRVGQALPQVQVLAAYADPDERIIASKFPWLVDSDEGYEDESDVDRARRRAMEMARMGAGAVRRPGASPLKAITVVKTERFTFPGAFEELRRLPCVYVIDPQGKVAKEYPTGVFDEKIYADVQNLMAGGDGDSSATSLPYDIKPVSGFSLGAIFQGGAMLIMGVLMFVLVIAGLVYWPMANVLMGVFDSPTTPFLYPAGFRAIAVAWKDYLALALVLIGLSLLAMAWAVIGGFLFGAMLPWPLDAILVQGGAALFGFYSQIVQYYAIGRYYYANKEAIGWL